MKNMKRALRRVQARRENGRIINLSSSLGIAQGGNVSDTRKRVSYWSHFRKWDRGGNCRPQDTWGKHPKGKKGYSTPISVLFF